MGCDREVFWNHPQVQASFGFWQKNVASLDFVHRWLEFCLDRAIVTDDPNLCGFPNLFDFIEHRHDQSVLTNLVIKFGLRAFGRMDRQLAPADAMKQIEFVAQNFYTLQEQSETG